MREIPNTTKRRQGRRKRQVLAFVQDTIAAFGEAPSYGMIADALGIPTRANVRQIVAGLEAEGKLRRAGFGKVRRIRLGAVA